MRPRIYVDTPVFGGCEDTEFIGHLHRLVAAMVNGDDAMVISALTLLELEKAPAAVRAHLERIPESLVEVLSLDAEAEALFIWLNMARPGDLQLPDLPQVQCLVVDAANTAITADDQLYLAGHAAPLSLALGRMAIR